MFGYLTALPGQFSGEALARYRSLYCGLCAVLGKNYGFFGRMTLKYDFAFLAALLQAVVPKEENVCAARCPVHPFKPCRQVQAQVLEYCADLNILLAYDKLSDDWQDERDLSAYIGRSVLASSAAHARMRQPQAAKVIREKIDRLAHLERANESSCDVPADCFGELMGALFALQGCATQDKLYAFGFELGRLIYLMDALMDLKQDLKRGRYNPLTFVSRADESLLEAQAAKTVQAYEALPILQDKEMLDTVLYQGIWNQYEKKRMREAKRREGRGAAK